MKTLIVFLILALSAAESMNSQQVFNKIYEYEVGNFASFRSIRRLNDSTLFATGYGRSRMAMLLNNEGEFLKSKELIGMSGSNDHIVWIAGKDSIGILGDNIKPRTLRLTFINSQLDILSDTAFNLSDLGIPEDCQYCCFDGLTLNNGNILLSIFNGERTGNRARYNNIVELSPQGEILRFKKLKVDLLIPLFQRPNGDICWRIYFPNPKVQIGGAYISNSDYEFDFTAPFDYFLDGASTSDGGFLGANLISARFAGYGYHIAYDVKKYDSALNHQWTTRIPTVASDDFFPLERPDGGYYIVSTSVADSTLPADLKQCNQDIAISRIESNGFLSGMGVFGSGVCTNYPFAAMLDTDGGVIVGGINGGDNLVNPPCWEFYRCPSSEEQHAWIFKTDSMFRFSRVRISDANIPDLMMHRLAMFPNPAGESARIEYEAPFPAILYEVLALDGRVAYAGMVDNPHSGAFQLDTSYLPSGIYVLRLRSNSESMSLKFSVVK